MNIWSVILSPDFLFTSIRVMTPILFAAMACMVFVKGGIDPIGTCLLYTSPSPRDHG